MTQSTVYEIANFRGVGTEEYIRNRNVSSSAQVYFTPDTLQQDQYYNYCIRPQAAGDAEGEDALANLEAALQPIEKYAVRYLEEVRSSGPCHHPFLRAWPQIVVIRDQSRYFERCRTRFLCLAPYR